MGCDLTDINQVMLAGGATDSFSVKEKKPNVKSRDCSGGFCNGNYYLWLW